MKPEEIFLNKIAEELKTPPGLNIREEVFFPLRYAKNRPVTVQHTTIARDDMPKDDRLGKGDYVTSIGTTSQNVVQAMVNKYKEEMAKDEVNIDILVNGQQGQRGTWREVYKWLWEQKYPRWLEAHSWDILREKATSPANWIGFLTEEDKEKVVAGEKVLGGGFRGAYLDLPPAPEPEPEITPIIPANKRLLMQIDLEYPQYQLLLFNRSEAGTVLYCPSFGYAPQPIIEKPPVVLPQRDSWAGETKQNFLFKDKGQEEFLAIVLAKPLNLPWLAASKQEGIPKWNGQRILEVFNHLEQSGEWQVFYQSFEVVELKPADA